ncbi:SLC13 family permease [Pontibacter sp. G13]|uniref:SLC13 family permease n=1 Tax=Pontibacter sp. G13 TaxID=3074898 RepID=UPI00288B9E01|nr:SLC13 family permease [Pontibacter sp. G13]WNJ16345.1 SLC13 family permease [Pontibacter sp. G13]
MGEFLLLSNPVAHYVPTWVIVLHGAILALMILALALEEKIHANKSVITGIAAMIALIVGELTGVLSLFDGGHGHVPFYVEFIDWGVIAIILGSSLFVEVTTQSGIFSWLAIKLTKYTQGDPFKLLVAYSWMTVVFSAFLNNVTAMIIVGSLTTVSLEKLNRRDLLLGFLLAEGLLTNIGGLLTLISSVPNIILGNAAGISFIEFTYISAPYVVIATLCTIYLASWRFGIKGLKTETEKSESKKRIAAFDERDGIESQSFFVLSWVVFIGFILALATTDVIPYIKELGIGFVAMAFGVSMLLRVKNDVQKVYVKTDWDLLFFFAFLFVVIGVMEHAAVLEQIGGLVAGLMNIGETTGPLALLWASGFASSVTDNIPLAAMLAKTLQPLSQGPNFASNIWWATIYGCNLGGNITPIGSASTVVAVTIIARNKLSLGFVGFVKQALPFAIVHLILASVYVWLLGILL